MPERRLRRTSGELAVSPERRQMLYPRRLPVSPQARAVIDQQLDDFAGIDTLPRQYALDGLWGILLVTVWLPDGRVATAIVDSSITYFGFETPWQWSWR